jgi:hypothetical protein
VIGYLLGCGVGGGLTGLVLAMVGLALQAVLSVTAMAALVAAVVTIAAVLQWQGRLGPFPQRRAQVPRRWLLWPKRVWTGAVFGLVIGSSITTHLRFAAAHALGAILLLAPSPAAGALAGALFGLARGGTLVITWGQDRFVGRRRDWMALAEGVMAVRMHRALAGTSLISAGAAALIVTTDLWR